MKKILTLLLVLGIGYGVYYFVQRPDANNIGEWSDVVPQELIYGASLTDVTEGTFINGYSTKALASGVAEAKYEDNKYTLRVELLDLPELDDDYFYEGWVVRKGASMDVISTGEAHMQADGTVLNIYESSVDLIDHDFYVLTLEPRDDNPAPADHILEGTFILQ